MGNYIAALWKHWVSLMSGVAGLLVGIGLRVGKNFSTAMALWSDIPDWLFICIGTTCLFFAGYAAWRDERRALVALRNRLKTPELRCELQMLSIAPSGNNKQDSIIAVSGAVTNPLGPPSAACGWSMKLEFPDGTELLSQCPLLPSESVRFTDNQGNGIMLETKKFWPDIGMQPIPSGGIIGGWFWGIFKGITNEQAQRSVVVITFSDAVTGTPHYVRHPVLTTGRFLDPTGTRVS